MTARATRETEEAIQAARNGAETTAEKDVAVEKEQPGTPQMAAETANHALLND